MNYINTLKLSGCCLCNYKNSDLPRFFHFDHIDPSTKIDAISEMIRCKKYSIEDVIDEIKKCRILCLHCHMIHTKTQWDNDVYRNLIRENK